MAKDEAFLLYFCTMPFILPSGDSFRINYFNVIKNNGLLFIEYLLDGKLIATQEMSVDTSQEFMDLVKDDSHQAEVNFNINSQIIHADSFLVSTDPTHVTIEFYQQTLPVLKQRMTIDTAKKIAKEIAAS